MVRLVQLLRRELMRAVIIIEKTNLRGGPSPTQPLFALWELYFNAPGLPISVALAQEILALEIIYWKDSNCE
jgi:hypothetical protein